MTHTHELIEKPKLFEFSEVEDPQRPSTAKEDLTPEEQKELKTNAKILRSIEKDVKRTRTELSFFRQAIDQSRNIKSEDLDRLDR